MSHRNTTANGSKWKQNFHKNLEFRSLDWRNNKKITQICTNVQDHENQAKAELWKIYKKNTGESAHNR